MKLGFFGIGSGVSADPNVAISLAQHAEGVGLESMWTGEHVVLPSPRQPPSPAEPEHPMLHPSTVLSFLAARTTSIRLGTGIVLIAQRNPLVLAKEMASLDVLSNGRLELGIGAGYLHQEFAALGIPFRERGARSDEYIEIMRALWNMERPSFKGRFYEFSDIDAQPRPVQRGGPPIVVGGSSDGALRRAAKYGHGWYGFAMNVEQTASVVKRLHALDGGEALEISVTPAMRVDRASMAAFAAIGVDRIISLVSQDEDRAKLAMDSLVEERSKL
ncbi:MAG: LLM class F420-dependent oxidoreductase [Gammaproteobacteria bacterium]|nr:LLM class F420-dependent oxidoreductase [Gammaproteobacteria bacterium]